MDDLISKLRAALDEDERLAREAAIAPPIQFFLARQVGKEASSRFLHAHAPERVLRQIAAMRKILDWVMNEDHCDNVDHLWSLANPDDVVEALAEVYGIEP